MHHILNMNGRFKQRELLERQHNCKIDIMTYNSIKSAIPKPWIKQVRKEHIKTITEIKRGDIKINDSYKNLTKLTSKDILIHLLKLDTNRPTALYRWEEICFYAIFDWQYIFCLPYRITHETSLQSLQYQIINHYLPCNANFHTWKKSTTPQ